MSISPTQLTALAPPPPRPLEEDEEDDDSLYLDEEDTMQAVDLLRGAKQLLGFYGDKYISGNIVVNDRKRMIKYAGEIEEFLSQIDNEWVTE